MKATAETKAWFRNKSGERMSKQAKTKTPTAAQTRPKPSDRSGLGPQLGLHWCRMQVDRGLGARSMRNSHSDKLQE
jgi:hypothetical protein